MRSNLALLLRGARPPTRALQGPGPDRREWWVGGGAGGDCRVRVQDVRLPVTTHSGPLGLRGPLRCHWDPPRAAGPLALGDPVLPTRYTHLVPPRLYPFQAPTDSPRPRHARPDHRPAHPRACTYDQFRPVVGEPRGIEHTAVLGSQSWFILYLRFTRPFD